MERNAVRMNVEEHVELVLNQNSAAQTANVSHALIQTRVLMKVIL